jgi:hypothetical protein
MSIVSVRFPYVCPVFNTWFEYPELPLLLLIALYMFFISRMECSTRMPYVSQWAVQAFHLVYATFSIFICLYRGFYCVLYSISCSKCYFYFCISKKLRNFSCFFSTIWENGPLFWCCGSLFLILLWFLCYFVSKFMLYLLLCSIFFYDVKFPYFCFLILGPPLDERRDLTSIGHSSSARGDSSGHSLINWPFRERACTHTYTH